MEDRTRKIILIVVVAIVVVAIGLLEYNKPVRLSNTAQDIIVAPVLTLEPTTPQITTTTQIATTTQATTTTASSTPVKKTQSADRSVIQKQKADQYPRAKEIADPQGFINTPSFKLADLVGKKVVLLDFWTYSCINCIRTIPYLNAWYQKYKDQGFVIVGVHTPEFDFEKNIENVSKAVQDFGIKYPVVLDNNYGTWNAYNNHYWPHHFLIDVDGFIVEDHIGEGRYAETERAIQKALQERQVAFGLKGTINTSIVSPANVITPEMGKIASPETYFGSARNEFLANGTRGVAGNQTMEVPSALDINQLYLGGVWNFTSEYAETVSGSTTIAYKYKSKNIYLVTSSKNGVKIKVTRDGQPLGAEAGKDVDSDGFAFIKDNRLYDLIKGVDYGTHTIEIEVQDAGLQAYAFTFG